jgi:hypothetical protein
MEDSTGIVDMFSQATKYVYMEWLYIPLIQGVPELADQIETVYSLMVIKVKNV